MSNDRMQRQRFELKYMLDEDQAVAIREFLAAHLELDENGVGKPNFSYLREAYVDPMSDNVRVTLDRAVRTEARTEPIFTTTMQNPSLPFGDRVILELKFTDRFPGWCRQLVERFGLMQCGAAKYCEGLAGLPEFGVSHAGDFRETPQSQHLLVQPESRPRNRVVPPRFIGTSVFA